MDKDTRDALQHVDVEGNAHSIYYLAYGSNLSEKKFLGDRGIRPISQKNVLVPSLRLMFDLEALPYKEPAMGNSGIRQQEGIVSVSAIRPEAENQASHDLETATASTKIVAHNCPEYHKFRWHKGLVGVAYELTPSDFARVIATEGGGARYLDVKVECYEIERGLTATPEKADGKPFVAHTLYAPPNPPVGSWPAPRPLGYAQPSARYLKLITDGAAERDLPADYREYLASIRPYRAQTLGTKLGGMILAATFSPLVFSIFALQRMFQDKNGFSPRWLVELFSRAFKMMWWTYDHIFYPVFGDGERSLSDICEEDGKPHEHIETRSSETMRK